MKTIFERYNPTTEKEHCTLCDGIVGEEDLSKDISFGRNNKGKVILTKFRKLVREHILKVCTKCSWCRDTKLKRDRYA